MPKEKKISVLGRNILQLRKQQGKTQMFVVDKAGLFGKAHLSRLENGATQSLHPQFLPKVAKALNTTVDKLLLDPAEKAEVAKLNKLLD